MPMLGARLSPDRLRTVTRFLLVDVPGLVSLLG